MPSSTSHSPSLPPLHLARPLTPCLPAPPCTRSSTGSRPDDAEIPPGDDDDEYFQRGSAQWGVEGPDGSFRRPDTGQSKFGRYAMPETPRSPGTESMPDTPRYLWPGEGLGLGLQTAFLRVDGERKEEIDELLRVLGNIVPPEGGSVDDLMSQTEFWRALERLEGKFLDEDDLSAANLDVGNMVKELQHSIARENLMLQRLVQSEVDAAEILAIQEDDYIFSQEVMMGTPRDATLTGLMPDMSDNEAMRRFIKYNFYRTRCGAERPPAADAASQVLTAGSLEGSTTALPCPCSPILRTEVTLRRSAFSHPSPPFPGTRATLSFTAFPRSPM